MSSLAFASGDNLNAPLHVSTIDISLATDSKKKIQSFQVKVNNRPLKGPVCKVIGAGEEHREMFESLILKPTDCITILANCDCQTRKRVAIDFRLRDIDCMRNEANGRSYRKKIRNIEVVLNGHHTMPEALLAATAPILQSCPRFRLLVIGNSGVGKSSLVSRVFGVEEVYASGNVRGYADINREFKSPKNDRFVVHDSLGFESGDGENIERVKRFAAERQAAPRLEDRLHAIWLCLEIPYTGSRLLEAGVERFLERRDEILGKIPLVVVLTKLDLLVAQLDIDAPANRDPDSYKSKWLNEHCIQPLHRATRNSIAHITVSVGKNYSQSITDLVKVTLEHMDEYHADEAPRLVASIAQRVSIKEKIQLSIDIGKKKYWNTLRDSTVFRGHTVQECLEVIHHDIITVWNFTDPDKCLVGDKTLGGLICMDVEAGTNGSNAGGATSNAASFANLLTSGVEILKGVAEEGDPHTAIFGPVAAVVISLLQMTYETYREAKKDVKIFMTFIVDLICVMQVIFLLSSCGRDHVTVTTIDRAVQFHKDKVQEYAHWGVEEFDMNMGIFLGTRDNVLDKVEALIWRFSITDQQFEELKRRISPGSAPLSSS